MLTRAHKFHTACTFVRGNNLRGKLVCKKSLLLEEIQCKPNAMVPLRKMLASNPKSLDIQPQGTNGDLGAFPYS